MLIRWNLANDRRKPYYPGMVVNTGFVPGTDHRFMVEKISTADYGTVGYRLRDAATVTMAQVAAGIGSRVVLETDNLAAIVLHCEEHANA